MEDHEDTNRSLTQLLRRRGYHVQPAHNIANALDAAAKEEFDVLVSDIGLPDGTGVELMQQLSAARPIFGIALTGFGMEEDIQKSHDGGFYHHLIKPVDLNKLDSIIQQVPGEQLTLERQLPLRRAEAPRERPVVTQVPESEARHRSGVLL